MNYECPFCSSKKKPQLISPFPKIVKCLECGKNSLEIKFIYNDEKSEELLNRSKEKTTESQKKSEIEDFITF